MLISSCQVVFVTDDWKYVTLVSTYCSELGRCLSPEGVHLV